ncbi:ribosome hibernation-promoting factor, HPF/YfiA family [Sphingomicrobium astaxanthinifaciens]|uniref:ribosome hibernation-promoting factor, HPF/YfiA family n=1 Tax=Sphingomicrobium astaxanthinifaciens TaxID=1227949 RepID=UPI001FCB5FBA|nr:ribosome-associated translation inhibitor RaiA [Sphingomicrobium astaxanthinifaciens]MCJ7421168.1 ribosome-associated translation inhibitor RaiA [Sphingomicrobium astaxanthinifaciens]
MDIRVAGHQVDTGAALQDHVADRIESMTEKYFSRAVAANVTFGRAPHDQFRCDIVAPVSNGHVLKASNRAGDAHVAFEGAADKIERQLKRYAERLRERRSEPMPDLPAEADYRVLEIGGDDDQPASEAPAIVAETHTDIPKASVGDAVMMLDLRNANALMFRNTQSDELNMVYRRDDGTIGWVEPGRG